MSTPPDYRRDGVAACASEGELLRRAAAGDTPAFDRIVEMYTAPIYRHAFRIVRNRQEAEDVTQEAFLKAYRGLGAYDFSKSFRSWLYAIATNTGLNALRKQRRRREAPFEEAEFAEAGTNPAARNALKEEVAVILAELMPRDALLLQLHYAEGMSIREAGDVVGLSEGAAKTALCRARKRMRELLIERDKL
ncbi:MAG: RNA polymerase sigma factor [Candidatus Hydrogenedentes bacterium]|nr:RNA polymerase sigma factor [Candidatus Hydrogenedentota bacterium]